MLELLTGLTVAVNSDFKKAYSLNIDGKPFYLTAYWVDTPPQAIRYRDVLLKNETFRTGSADESLFPVLPDLARPNEFKKWLFVSENPSWINLYGNWMIGDVLPSLTSPIPTQFNVMTERGEKTVYPRELAWSNSLNPDNPFSLWTHSDKTGPCGGAYRVGTNKMCPYAGTYTINNHEDIRYRKFIFLGG